MSKLPGKEPSTSELEFPTTVTSVTSGDPVLAGVTGAGVLYPSESGK